MSSLQEIVPGYKPEFYELVLPHVLEHFTIIDNENAVKVYVDAFYRAWLNYSLHSYGMHQSYNYGLIEKIPSSQPKFVERMVNPQNTDEYRQIGQQDGQRNGCIQGAYDALTDYSGVENSVLGKYIAYRQLNQHPHEKKVYTDGFNTGFSNGHLMAFGKRMFNEPSHSSNNSIKYMEYPDPNNLNEIRQMGIGDGWNAGTLQGHLDAYTQ